MTQTVNLSTARGLLTLPEGKRRTTAAARALAGLIEVAPSPAAKPEAAIATFQELVGLPASGHADDATVARLVAEVAHRHVASSPLRTAKVQALLAKVGLPAADQDLSTRRIGDSTLDAVKQFQEKHGLTVDGLVGDITLGRLKDEALTVQLGSHRQTGLLQRKLLRAASIRHLDLQIDPAELRTRTSGPTTQAAVKALQESLGLPTTGEVDSTTFDRVSSVAASKHPPVLRVGKPDPTDLAIVPRQLRLNMANQHVPRLQRALAFLGHAPTQAEFAASKFGPSTRRAVIAFQAEQGLPQTGAVDGTTLNRLNHVVRAATAGPAHSQRIRGSVRDAAWLGRAGVVVELATDPIAGAPTVLATRHTLANGFYDLPYEVPTDPSSGQPVSPLHLRVRFLAADGSVIGEKRIANPTAIAWVNFTEGPYPYRGSSIQETQLAALAAIGVTDVRTLVENAERADVSRVARQAGLAQDDVMRLILAARAADELGAPLDAVVCYAFLAQSLPSNLPDDLLAQTHEWTLIDQLVDLAASGIVATEPGLAKDALDGAVAQNLVPVTLAARQDEVLAGLAAARQRFALDAPLLVGNGTLRGTLERTDVPADRYPAVADVFVATGGLGPAFWEVLRARPDDFGGTAVVASLAKGVEVGLVAKNHPPMVTLLEERIADPGHPELTSTRDLARLDPDQWTDLVSGLASLPPGIDGDTDEDRRRAYARTMESQSHRLFPTVALTAAVRRTGAGGLTRADAIETLVDEHPDLELRATNVDSWAAKAGVGLDTDVRSELRVLQRVHRLAPTIDGATALLSAGIHSSVQAIELGRERFVELLVEKNVEAPAANAIFGYAEFQYAQVLQRVGEFRSEVQSTIPAALAPYRTTAEVRDEVLQDLPDLELLFGSLDACDCPHCVSVYGPAAYLADLLRFLDSHNATLGGGTVREVMSARRPDITQVRLDCDNTETPLPFIDLTNEVLESVYPGSQGLTDLQTTLPADELRAAPEHQDDSVYDDLRTSQIPISSAYDLWQDQTRVLLSHLGVPRWRLMSLLAPDGVDAARDADIAAEFFEISSAETTLVVTPTTAVADQGLLWGFDASRTSLPVLEVMERTGLGYRELQLLLQALWLTPDGDPRLHLQRPATSADLRLQTLEEVTPDVLDRIHRFVRLGRHTPWDHWELDLLLRAARIGASSLDGPALVQLKAAAQLAEQFGLGAADLAAWFGTIPTVGRPTADDPTDTTAAAPSLYRTTFARRIGSGLPDAAFDPQPDGSDLSTHRPALLAALAVTDAALTALLARTGTTNDLPTLSRLVGWSGLARSLGLDLAELLAAADLVVTTVPDPFASPVALRRFLDLLGELRAGGVAITEQDYLLSSRPASPLAPADDTVALALWSVREAIRTDPAVAPAGQVRSSLAAITGLLPSHLEILLDQSDTVGTLLDAYVDPAVLAVIGVETFELADLTAAAFPRLFQAHRRVLKMARVVQALGLTVADLTWFVAHPDATGLRLPSLPVETAPATSLFPGWLRAVRWRRARRDLAARAAAAAAAPGSAPASTDPGAPDAVLAAATAPAADVTAIRALAAPLTGFPSSVLQRLDGNQASSYADLVFLQRLADAATAVQRLGVPATVARDWADRESGAPSERVIAGQVLDAAKSKYERPAWLVVLQPLQDVWRERKRDALVAFLLENSARTQPETVVLGGNTYPNPLRWSSSDDLLRHFLIDVEVAPCAVTSRIKQAIGSVQMFVQRAQLNLEKPQVVITAADQADLSAPNSWRQWRWMKNYRLWEANRKIFLYPENWIEPELRDDKTPFFVDLEQEILTGEITAERCEDALRTYLGKLKDVANLEVVGVHHEIDDDHPWDDLGPSVNVLHVIGRTRGEPFRYYYRRYDLNAALWSPWEKVDLDITGDQVLPVVYNRTLHLFWLQIGEKPQRFKRQPAAQPSSSTQPAPEPPSQLELKLAWTTRHGTGWTAKQTAPQVLVHPWPRPHRSYTLKPRYHSAVNQLWLDVYISMSPEFNNGAFWDPFDGVQRQLTGRRFDESARPWHSSSFVFDGQVSELRIKPLDGQYRTLRADGSFTPNLGPGDSFTWVQAIADPQRRVLQPLKTNAQVSARVALPLGMHLEAGRFRNDTWTPNGGNLTVLQSGASVTLLTGARAPFAAVHSLHRIQQDTALERSPFIYSDQARSWFVTSQWVNVTIDSTTSVQRLSYTFAPFSHPYAPLMLRELNRSGPDGVLNRTLQLHPEAYPPGNAFNFSSYAPVAGVSAPAAGADRDRLDFSRSGAMSVYNWEVFFHVPFLIACRLTTNQRFDEALAWFHRIFDPSNTETPNAPQRYWITKPFFEATDETYQKQRIEDILANANTAEVSKQIAEWRNHPFMPDVIARFRPVAYQKAVVMKYIDALVAWGDQLFRRETIESLNEATLLYVLAGELLGRRPEHVPMVRRDGKSYAELTADAALDAFGNQQVEVQLENLTERPTLVVASDEPGGLPVVHLSYFGLPANDALLGYWDTVADRLFKLRHCMDLSGRVRQLPLFEPPIDPALLVRAVAAGIDLNSVLDDTPASGSPYRYQTLFAAAMSCAGDVRALGERMLSALERRDSDALERLRAGNDLAAVGLVERVRNAQVLEAQRSREAVEASRESIIARRDYYQSRPYMNDWETAATVVHTAGVISQIVATVLNTVAGGASLVPSFKAGASGFGGSPVVTVEYGGNNVSNSVSAFARLFEGLGGILHSTGSLLETQGGYQRRAEESAHQADVAVKDLAQAEKQVIAAQVREAVAQSELVAHQRTVENAQSIEDFLRNRYTNAQLYEWTVSQLSTVYFQAFQLAFDLARRAERAYRFESGDNTSAPVVRFGYWDSLTKGLLAGDRLVNDLRRLESLALERSRRRLQATTHVSLANLLPDKLLELKTNGTTSIELAEWMFARENPGWFNQRIRSVAVSAPGVAGPYVGVHATLAMTAAVVRRTGTKGATFGDPFGGSDLFANALPAVSVIRTSHGVADRGRIPGDPPDDRYEPFEGAGLISRWTITMDPRDNAFDLATMADLVLTIDYEGDEGTSDLVTQAREAVVASLPRTGVMLLWLNGSLATQWSRFLHPTAGEQVFTLDVGSEQLSYRHREAARVRSFIVTQAEFVVDGPVGEAFDVRATPPAGTRVAATTGPRASFGGLQVASFAWAGGARNLLGSWQLQFKRQADGGWDALGEDVVQHAWLVLHFEASGA